MNLFYLSRTLILITLLCIGKTLAGEKPLVLIAYYSQSGNTEKMAEAVREGAAENDSVKVVLMKVEEVGKEDLEKAAGIIIGSPTYYANMAAPVKKFIDSWFEQELVLFDKVGGAFATGGGRTAGRELVITGLLLAMLNNGMIVAGPHYESWGTFGASAITAPPDEGVSDSELDDARRLGRRITDVVLQMNR
ncbi:MAG: NAD(P)H-dependent oxidoreductase [Calditrichota bacterium]